MRAIMFNDEIAIRVLEIGSSTWLLGLDVLQATKMPTRLHASMYGRLIPGEMIHEPSRCQGRPRKLVSPAGAKRLFPDPRFIEWVDEIQGP